MCREGGALARTARGKRGVAGEIGVVILNASSDWCVMGRNLSLLAHLPRFEPDGVTHRRDCECVRCDAGYRPTEHERAVAQRRWDEAKVREAAARALARRKDRARVRAAAVSLELGAEARAVDQRIGALRAARARADEDQRLALLQALRRSGMSLAAALSEVERRSGEARPKAASVGPAGFEPATNGLKVRSSTN